MNIDPAILGALIAAFVRASALAATAPVIGDTATPIRARLAFVVAITIGVGLNRPGVPLAELPMVVVLELASGHEVYTSRHKPEVAARFREMAETKRKLWTSSSDDHQNAAYTRPPCGTPVRTLERIARRTVPIDWLLA